MAEEKQKNDELLKRCVIYVPPGLTAEVLRSAYREMYSKWELYKDAYELIFNNKEICLKEVRNKIRAKSDTNHRLSALKTMAERCGLEYKKE